MAANVNRFRRRDRLSGAESDAPQGLGFDRCGSIGIVITQAGRRFCG